MNNVLPVGSRDDTEQCGKVGNKRINRSVGYMAVLIGSNEMWSELVR
jgi:hypothetical protein